MNIRNYKNVKLIYEVAKWEFQRWFKFKEQIRTLLIAAILSLLVFGGKSLIEKKPDKQINIVVINSIELPIKLSKSSNIKLLQKEKVKLNHRKYY
ncbi:MAG: hypothetical protein H8D22_10945 [Candidatus Cloacimonetes bacterium]|nr:hypothetical protein [Candidatus Cloacimonadota bacterium]